MYIMLCIRLFASSVPLTTYHSIHVYRMLSILLHSSSGSQNPTPLSVSVLQFCIPQAIDDTSQSARDAFASALGATVALGLNPSAMVVR